ncbi:MAG: HYR domain-containing protein [Thermoplasmatota archaeon]
MARKKRVEEGEEGGFGPPPFDERRFYRTELEAAKAALLAAGWGLAVALISTGLLALTGDFLFGAGAGVAAVFLIKPILDLSGVSYEGWDWTKAGGTLVSFALSWLAFWVLLSNPPVMDLAPPVLLDRTPPVQELGGPVGVVVSASDNSGISSLSASVRGPEGVVKSFDEFLEDEPGVFRLGLNYTAPGVYTYEVRARDTTGRSSGLKGSYELLPSAPPEIRLIAPDNGTNITYEQAIMLYIPDNARVASVYYLLDGGPENVSLKMDRRGYESYTKDIYRIRTNQPGHAWSGGRHTILVVATDAAGNRAEATFTFTLI